MSVVAHSKGGVGSNQPFRSNPSNIPGPGNTPGIFAAPKDRVQAEMLSVLRADHKKMEQKLQSIDAALIVAERSYNKEKLARESIEESFDALLAAVHILASEVGNVTASDRRARERARKLLEDQGLKPPATLGSSRERVSKKPKRRLKILTVPPGQGTLE